MKGDGVSQGRVTGNSDSCQWVPVPPA